MTPTASSVVFVSAFDRPGILSPFLNAAGHWSDTGWAVHLVWPHWPGADSNLPSDFTARVITHPLAYPWKLYRLWDALHRRGSPAWGQLAAWAWFVGAAAGCLRRLQPAVVIPTDPPALAAVAAAGLGRDTFRMYYQQEMLHARDCRTWLDRLAHRLERRGLRASDLLVGFDEVRNGMVMADHDCRDLPALAVPNAPVGPARPERSAYLRDALGLSGDRIILLYTGSVAEWTGVGDVMDSLPAWPSNIDFVIHCLSPTANRVKAEQRARPHGARIRFTAGELPYDAVDKVYSSADIGLAWYTRCSLNHEYAGLSSGKLFQFIQAGVPVITNDTPACRAVVGERGLGICLRDLSELPSAMARLLADREGYRSRCLAAFADYEFRRRHARVLEMAQARRESR